MQAEMYRIPSLAELCEDTSEVDKPVKEYFLQVGPLEIPLRLPSEENDFDFAKAVEGIISTSQSKRTEPSPTLTTEKDNLGGQYLFLHGTKERISSVAKALLSRLGQPQEELAFDSLPISISIPARQPWKEVFDSYKPTHKLQIGVKAVGSANSSSSSIEYQCNGGIPRRDDQYLPKISIDNLPPKSSIPEIKPRNLTSRIASTRLASDIQFQVGNRMSCSSLASLKASSLLDHSDDNIRINQGNSNKSNNRLLRIPAHTYQELPARNTFSPLLTKATVQQYSPQPQSRSTLYAVAQPKAYSQPAIAPFALLQHLAPILNERPEFVEEFCNSVSLSPDRKDVAVSSPSLPSLSCSTPTSILKVVGFDLQAVGPKEIANLFSNYGNIEQVLTSRHQNVCIMVYSSIEGAASSKKNLEGLLVQGGKTLRIEHMAEQTLLAQVGKNFSKFIPRKRFSSKGSGLPNRVNPPSRTLHATFHGDHGETVPSEDQVFEFFSKIEAPQRIKRDSSARAPAMWFVEYASISTAVNMIMQMHNRPVEGGSYRLSFTKTI